MVNRLILSGRVRRLTLGAIGALVASTALLVGVASAADHAVGLVEKRFEPAQITIAPGDTVVWTVTEAIPEPHSVTSGEPDFSGQGGIVFDSGTELRENGDTFQHTFDVAGVYAYFCQVHPVEMTGQVIVVAPGTSPPAVDPPPSEAHTGVPAERRLLAGGILFLSIVLMFGMAWVWRRMNPA